MILTKAYIISLPERDSNIFKVRIPLMEDNTGTEAIFDALLCYSPDTFNGYAVGDCVYVHFEDNKNNIPVILGKLFVNIPDASSTYSIVNNLKVTGGIQLPDDTKLGNYSAADISNLYNAVENGNLVGGGGSIDPSKLKQYVQWVNTEREEGDYYSDRIRCVTGEEYDKIINHEPPFEDEDDETINKTLYFLDSVPESERERDANIQK